MRWQCRVPCAQQLQPTWCPYDLQLNPLKDIGEERCPCFIGSDAKHPPFNPCLSACSKYGDSAFCCTGKHGSAKKCGPNYYSQAAKRICPDAYSYAFDDSKSTFAVPMGSGFEVVFCPGGRSTTILKTLADPSGTHSAASTRMIDRSLALLAAFVTVAIAFLG